MSTVGTTADADLDRLARTLEADRASSEYASELLMLEYTAALEQRMAAAGVSRAGLAARMGVSRPMVTKLLRGTCNLTIRTMAAAASAVGCRVALTLEPAPAPAATTAASRRARSA